MATGRTTKTARLKRAGNRPAGKLDTAAIQRLLLRRMKKLAEFPALSQNVSELNATIANEYSSAAQLANVILKDQALTTKLIKVSNSAMFGAASGKIKTVSHAVVMIGFEGVKQTALGLMLFEQFKTRNKEQAEAYRNATVASLLSGIIAKNVLDEARGIPGEEAFVCGAMHNLGKHLAVLYLPKEMAEVRRRVAAGQSENKALQGVLGLSYEAIGQAMAKHWRLPKRIHDTMARARRKHLPPPSTPFDFLHHAVIFANEMTSLATNAKIHEREARLMLLNDRFRNSIKLTDRQLKNLFYKVVVQMRDYATAVHLDIAKNDIVRAVLNASGIDIDPATLEIRIREKLEAQRAKKDWPLFGANAELDALARKLLRDLKGIPTEEAVAELREPIVAGAHEAGCGPSVDYAVQVLFDADDFEPPATAATREAQAIGVATVKTSGQLGRPALKLLVIVAGSFTLPDEDDDEVADDDFV